MTNFISRFVFCRCCCVNAPSSSKTQTHLKYRCAYILCIIFCLLYFFSVFWFLSDLAYSTHINLFKLLGDNSWYGHSFYCGWCCWWNGKTFVFFLLLIVSNNVWRFIDRDTFWNDGIEIEIEYVTDLWQNF